jgi:hypothetical protein
VTLKTSQTIRLQRKWPKAVYKADARQLILPVPPRVDAADYLVAALGELFPMEPEVGLATP